MGAGRGAWQSRLAVQGVSPTALRGCGAERVGDVRPVAQAWAARRQMQDDTPHRGLYPDTEFHELFAQGADLRPPIGGARGVRAQLLVEDVGGGAQQAAELVGEEAAAAGAVDLEAVMQLLDPILDVTAGVAKPF